MLYCKKCHKSHSDDTKLWRCECGSPFDYLPPNPPFFPKNKIKERIPSIWRYKEALPPYKPESIVTLGEGMTPLISVDFEKQPVQFKLDFVTPTGSFKDRGISTMVSQLKEQSIKKVIEDSSGNAGASLAAYCSYSYIKCQIYVPAYTSPGKLVQIEMVGAKTKKISGTREETSNAVIEASCNTYYASHNWNPFFLQGVKTIAFEIWEQMNWNLPDIIIVPSGQGSLVTGCYLGFNDLKNAGEINCIPRLFAIQAANCAPLYHALINGYDQPAIIEKKETIAEGISSAFPVRGHEVLSAIRESHGSILAVEEDEIVQAHQKIARLGIYVEPTSAVAVAGLSQMIQQKIIKSNDSVVAILTGSGLKGKK